MLRAEMLGGFRVWWQDQPIQFSSKQARSLLAYLLTYPQRHPRDHLAGLFWPDLSDDQARKRLSQTLWQIRQALGEGSGWVEADTEMVGTAGEARLESDYFHFSSALSSPDLNRWREALGLYRGEFLRGYYDDWVLEERDHLLQTLLAKLEQLIRHYRAEGEPKEALEMARKLAALEPLHDEAHQEVMRLCLLLGKPREALEHFRKARQALGELGEQPGPQLEALRQQAELARENPKQTLSPLEGSGGLMPVGRTSEYQMLLEVLAQVQQNQGRLVLLEGEAGMGKSRLLQELAREAGWRGFGLLQAKASERSAYKTFGLLWEALGPNLSALQLEQLRTQLEAPWLQAVAQVVPALAPSRATTIALSPEDEPGRMREGLARLLQSLASWAPQVLLLDDLHWADEGTLEVLPHLIRTLTAHPVLVILGYRSTEAKERAVVWSTLQKLSPAAAARVELKLLGQSETAELVRRSLGLAWPVPRFENRIYQETRGNPLFVLETLRSLYEEGLLHRDDDGVWSTPVDELTENYQELPLAPTVRQVIVERLGRLPSETRRVADTLAVLGAADLDVLTEVLAKPKAEVLDMAASLIRQGLLAEREGQLAFAHDKIAQAAYEEIPGEVRQHLHGRVAEVVETKQPSPELLARHFEGACWWKKAATAYICSGERAESLYVYANAIESYNKALELADQAGLSPKERISVLKKRSALLHSLDRNQEYFADLDVLEKLVGQDVEELCQLRNRRANALIGLGHIEQGRKLAQVVLEEAQARGWTLIQIKSLGVLATADQRSGKRDAALQKRQKALELSIGLQDDSIEAESRHALAIGLLFHQRYLEAKVEIKHALRLMHKSSTLYAITRVVSRLGPIWQALGKSKAAESVYRHVIRVYRSLGTAGDEASNSINWAQLAESRGQIALALGLYARAIEVFTAEGNLEGEASARVNLATLQAIWLADHEEAIKNTRIAQSFYTEVGDLNGLTYGEIVLGILERNQGNSTLAYKRLSADTFRNQGQKNRWLGVQLELLLAELSIDNNQLTVAAEHLQVVEDTANAFGMAALHEDIAEVKVRILLAKEQPLKANQILESLALEDKPNHHRHYLNYQSLKAMKRMAEAQTALQKAFEDLQEALEELSPQQLQASLERIPEHRLILQAWEAQNIQRQTFRIPSADAPTGRPLREGEYVEVAWTIHTPEDDKVMDKTQRRQTQLERLIAEATQQGAAPTVEDLAAALDSSKATIKRDLTALRAKGIELKTRGSRS